MPVSNIFLFTGENEYALRQELRRWQNEFSAKYGQENAIRLEAKEAARELLLDHIATAPFLAEKRLVVVEGIPSGDKEDVAKIVAAIHPATILVFVSPALDKRLGLIKELRQQATLKEFPPLSPAEMSKWLRAVVEKSGLQPVETAVSLLLKTVGPDQAALEQEVEKLSLFCGESPVNAEIVETLVVASAERQVWGLMDAIGAADARAALAYVRQLLRQGETAPGIWPICLWIFSQLTLIHAAVKSGTTQPTAIMKVSGASFGSVRSLVPLAKRLSTAQMQALISHVADTDLAFKTGRHRSTQEEPQEFESAIDQTLLLCCNV